MRINSINPCGNLPVVEMNARPILSIIIVSYNGKRFLEECVGSAQTHAHCAYEIIVVENGSQDGSLDFLRESFPGVNVIPLAINIGFARGANIGAQAAHGDLLLFLNADVFVRSDLSVALRAFDDPEVGAITCRLVYPDGQFQASYGYEHSPLKVLAHWWGLSRLLPTAKTFKIFEEDPRRYQKEAEVDFVSGAFLMVRSSLWCQVGGFDESMFMYVEEVDLCRRIRGAGYKLKYLIEPCVAHYGFSGRAWAGESALRSTAKSYLYYFGKYGNFAGFAGAVQEWLFRVLLGAAFVVRSVVHWAQSFLSKTSVNEQKAGAYLSVALSLFGLLNRRIAHAAAPTLSDAEGFREFHAKCFAFIGGFPRGARDATLRSWARSNASSWLLGIGKGWRDW